MNTSKYKMNISLTAAKMRNLFLLLLSLVTLIAPLSNAFAQQQYPVKIQPSVTFPSTFLSDYSDPANTNIRVFLSDVTKQDYAINVRVTLTNITTKGISYESIHGINITIDGGVAYFLNYNELTNLFALGDLYVSGSGGTEANVLPEGQYSMSMQAYDANLFPLVPVSNARTDFALFNVVRYDPPLLNTPTDKKEFDLQTTNQNIFFNWTPRHIAYSSQQIQYRYRLIRVLPVDRNPYDAVNASIAGATGNIDVDALDFATFIYSPTDLELVPGGVYAWQVQAYEIVQGKISTARFKNQGLSEVFTLSIKEQCNQISLITPIITGSAITFSWNSPAAPHSVYSEYEFNYRKANSSLPWTPIITTQTSITLDNTVLQTGVAYEYNVRARCNNWLEPVQGSSVTLAAPTCVAPAPLTVTTTASNSILSWTAVSGPDSLQLSYKVVGSSEPFTTKILSPADEQYALNLLSSGGYVVRLDAFCGAQTALGKQDTIAYNESGIVGPCPIPMPFELIATRERGKIDTANIKWNSMSVHTASSITYWHKDSSAVKYSYTQLIPGAGVNGRHVYNNQMYAYQIDYVCGNKHKLTPVGMFRILSTSGQLNLDPPTANCFPPVDIRAEARDTVTARVEWDKISGADSYELSYRVKGTTTPFETFNTTATNAILKPLQKNEKYQLLVRVKCSGVFSIYSDTAVVDLSLGRTRNCDTVTFFKALNKTTTNIQTAWNFDSTCTGYIIKFREEAQPLASEYTQAFTNIDTLKHKHVVRDTVRFTFQNLKSGTKYVFRIQKICGQNNALFNIPMVATTLADAKSSGACGSGKVCDKTPTTPLTSLKVGETIYCADYEIVVDSLTTATSNPSAGIYSGLGHMEMPVPGLGDFVNMHVSFRNVKINDKPNSCMYDGTINIDSMNASIIPTEIRDSIKALMAKAEGVIDEANAALAQIQSGIDQLQAGLQQGMDYFQGGDGVGNVKTGKLGETNIETDISTSTTSAGVNGNTISIGGKDITVASLPVLLRDNTDEVFQVTSTGAVTYVGKYDTAFAKNPTLDLTDQIVTYTEFSGATFDFDAYQGIFSSSIQLKSEYEKINDDYYVPAKFIIPGALDKVTATINTTNSDADKVVFSNSTGFVYAANPDGKKFTLNLAGGPASDGQYIYAWYVENGTKKAIGKLLLPSYAPQVKNVVIIPVKEPTSRVYTASTYESYLNQTYNKIGITYHVTIDDSFRNNTDWAPDGNTTVQPTGSSLLNDDYRGKEAAMIDAYVAFKGGATNLDPQTAYFLAVNEVSLMKDGDDILLGKMPPGEQFGFLYTATLNDGSIAHTVAHELGHGAYHLEHIYIGLYLGQINKKKTQNLMDYTSDGKELWKLQWDIVHDPGHVWGILRRDKDAALKKLAGDDLGVLSFLKNADKKTITFVTPAARPFTFVFDDLKSVTFTYEDANTVNYDDGLTTPAYLPNGSLFAFTLKNGKSYTAYKTGEGVFAGYKDAPTSAVYKDVYSQTISDRDVCVGLPEVKDKQIVFRVRKVDWHIDYTIVWPWPSASHDGSGDFIRLNRVVDISDITKTAVFPMGRKTSAENEAYLALNESEYNDFKMRGIKAISDFILAHPGVYTRYTDCKRSAYYKIKGFKDIEVSTQFAYIGGRTKSVDVGYSGKDINYETYCLYRIQQMKDFDALDKPKSDDWVAILKTSMYASPIDYGKLEDHLKDIKCLNINFRDVYKSLDIQVRKDLITLILNQPQVSTFRPNLSEVFEDAIINILTTASTKQQAQDFLSLLEKFSHNNGINAGIPYIWSCFDDAGGDDNLTGIIFTISALIDQAQNAVYNVQKIDYYSTAIATSYPQLEQDMLQFSNISVDFEGTAYLRVEIYGQARYNEIIPVRVAGTFKLGNVTYSKGTILFMPAIQAKLFSYKNTLVVAENSAWLAFDVGTCALGVGGAKVLFTAANWVRKAVIVADLVGTTAGIALQLVNNDFITQDQRAKIQIASLILNIPELATNIPKINNLITELDNTIVAYRASNVAAKLEAARSLEIARQQLALAVKSDLKVKIQAKITPANKNFSDEIAEAVGNDPNCDAVCAIGRFGCFTGNTLVETDLGYKSIADIKAGDNVMSFNHDLNVKEYKLVTTTKKQFVKALLLLSLSSGQIIESTANHPYYVRGQYRDAIDLKIGDTLFTDKTNYLTVISKTEKDTLAQVYNFTVSDNKNYFVGKPSVLVHNSCLADDLSNYPTLVANLDNLTPTLKGIFMTDFLGASASMLAILNKPNGVDSWKILQLAGSKFVKTNEAYLSRFTTLTSSVQPYIAKFTDAATGSTLTKFLDDCNDLNFRTYINDASNLLEVKGFLAHKTGVLTASENETIAEILSNDEIADPLVKKWLEYGDNMAAFRVNREAGVTFGNLMKTDLANLNSPAYKQLKLKVTDLDQRTIYSQVQFCLTGNCINKGEYWIPDFVLVMEKTDGTGTKYLDVIIVDAKISAGTGWTPNQTDAKSLPGWKIKSVDNTQIVKGAKVANFEPGKSVIKNGNFFKLFNQSGTIKVQ